MIYEAVTAGCLRSPTRKLSASLRRSLRYYTPVIHEAAFHLPQFAYDHLKEVLQLQYRNTTAVQRRARSGSAASESTEEDRLSVAKSSLHSDFWLGAAVATVVVSLVSSLLMRAR